MTVLTGAKINLVRGTSVIFWDMFALLLAACLTALPKPAIHLGMNSDGIVQVAVHSQANPKTAGLAAFVGRWKCDDKDAVGVIFEFKTDGSVVATGPAPVSAQFPKGTTLEAHATLTLHGNKGTLHITSLKIIAPENADAATKKTINDTNKALADSSKSKSTDDESGTIKWNSKDSFTVIDSKTKKATVYTRVKSEAKARS